MKRKLNESLTFPVKIDVVRLVNKNPKLNGQMDKIASEIEDTTDAIITKEESDGTVYMVIDGLTQDDIIDIFENDYYIYDVDNYFVYDDADDELDDIESDDDARAAAEDDMRDEYGDDYIDETCDDDARDCAIEDMRDEYGDDYIDMDEDYGLDDEGEWIDTEDDDYYDMIPDYDEVDPDDLDALDARDAAYADMEDDGIYDETYEDADEEFAGDDALNDSYDEFDECMEDSEFECYESLNNRKLRNRRRLLEKKKGCCPPKKGKKLVNLSEALKMRKAGLTTRDIVRYVKKPYLNESIISKAINKAKTEPRNDKKMKLIMKKKEIMQLKESLGAEKFNMICKAMKSGKKTLYSKKTINGKNITKYSAKELLELLNTIKKQHTNLMKSYKSLYESATKSTKRELRTAIENKERLMLILDEELTYRLTFKKLNKSKAINEGEENPLEPLPVDPTDGDETPDNDEEVELSRVVITVANQDAADELKQSLVDAGVPDDAIEFETDDETDDSEDSDDTDSDTDDNSDENTDTDDTTDKTSNESLHYNKFKKLLEDDDSESDTADDSTDDNAKDDEDSDASSDDSSDSEDKPIKVVLTNTDYVNDLADVLNNEYGISKEEFEEMIGGQIVDDSDDSDDSDESSDSDDDKSNDESKEDKPSTNGDDAVDAMSQEELDKLFGGN
ncbi:MAG: hypothetical protein [Vetruanivirus porcinprimi]|uniref:Uncharacterized protein n=1 Tax=phage Lak_Megaphage_RVC_AP1_GC26 TaxID=3109224 RepID=A0ABZ0Z5Z0_9CAUD|nr:MAG: hypothetical protein [phage Lak_Megaphage_RVC_AP1_GC26]